MVPKQNVWASQSLVNLLVRGSRRLEVVEHAFPRAVGGDSEAATRTKRVDWRNMRKMALRTCIGEIFRRVTSAPQLTETTIRNQTSQ
jgi:hypothetical protein